MRLGANVESSGVTYRIWAPDHDKIRVEVDRRDGNHESLAMKKEADGYHLSHDPKGAAGDRYGYRLPSGQVFPDPASRAQDGDVHGRSLVVDPRNYTWKDAAWQRPAYRDLVVYELHIGAFTPEGTFRAAIEKLPHLVELGVNAIELMPIGDFPGRRNWGYDGVLIYAPAHCYGSPDDLRALVDAAHAAGLAVLLDVVYNHFGPDGNYLAAYCGHFYCKRHHTPWGEGFNFDGKDSKAVREFFLGNPEYWMDEFHIDGFRFDATHEIKDDSASHILKELAAVVHDRGGYAIAEDARNEAAMIDPVVYGFDGVWADDFHHTLRVSQTGESYSYFGDFSGTLDEIFTTLGKGWFYSGQLAKNYGGPRGTDGSLLPPEKFVCSISNHDQTGNRALGERINHLVSPASYRALSALLCLSPFTPMLFMGQEWNTSTPFLFFSDHNDDLGRKITEGRKKEFAAFPEFAGGKTRQVPDPQAITTFESSKLNWEEVSETAHLQCLRLYRECLSLRKRTDALRPTGRDTWTVVVWGKVIAIVFEVSPKERYVLIFNVSGANEVQLPEENQWQIVLSSDFERFGGSRREDQESLTTLHFKEAETIFLAGL
jgi:maltooligosyltrehalose trehalohydrolase